MNEALIGLLGALGMYLLQVLFLRLGLKLPALPSPPTIPVPTPPANPAPTPPATPDPNAPAIQPLLGPLPGPSDASPKAVGGAILQAALRLLAARAGVSTLSKEEEKHVEMVRCALPDTKPVPSAPVPPTQAA